MLLLSLLILIIDNHIDILWFHWRLFFFYLIFTCNIKNMITEYELRTRLTIELSLYASQQMKKNITFISRLNFYMIRPQCLYYCSFISLFYHNHCICNEISTMFNISENSLLIVTHMLKKISRYSKSFSPAKIQYRTALFNIDS